MIYDSSDIMQCFADIDERKPVFDITFETDQQKPFKIEFDLQDKFLALASLTEVTILDLVDGVTEPQIV